VETGYRLARHIDYRPKVETMIEIRTENQPCVSLFTLRPKSCPVKLCFLLFA